MKKYTLIAFILLLCIAFVVKFAGPNLLKQYLAYGIGDCRSIPILCVIPADKPVNPLVNQEYSAGLIPHAFPRMSISCPKGFNLVQELIKRPYYKNKRNHNKTAMIYLLHQNPQDFIRLYPDVKKIGVNTNFEFMSKMQQADFNQIRTITDAFFVVIKSVLTPDLGNQKIARMVYFELKGKRGYINYNLSQPNNYFDCNVFDANDNYFKIYIKDKGATIDLNKVYTIISTVKVVD